MERIWRKINDGIIQEEVIELVNKLQILPLTAQILISRGMNNPNKAEAFIKHNLSELHDPYLMKDMSKAIERIKLAIVRKEKVLIYGDYDVDGITSVTLLMKALNPSSLHTSYYLPNRLVDGYGLSKRGIEFAQSNGVTLVITVDCGISAIDEIDYANTNGIDIIVTDHHEVKKNLPHAFAIINPKQQECLYPDKNLAGVGIIMKLIQALQQEGYASIDLNTLIEFACLGTIADIVPMIGENRIIIKYGLSRLVVTENIGLKALINICGLKDKQIDTWDVGFKISPRINAIGRLEDARLAIKLFLTESKEEAEMIANTLNEHNLKRQDIQDIIFQEAQKIIEEGVSPLTVGKKIFVVVGDDWHQGVIGIVASKIVEKYYQPAIVISCQDGLCKGSGRSIPGFQLLNGLNVCSDLLESYGGHAQAAGLTILPEKIDAFRDRINNYAEDQIGAKGLQPFLDVIEADLKDISFQLIDEIDNLLAPFGIGNPRPIFSTPALQTVGTPIIVGNNHLKLKVKGTSHEVIDAIGFNMGEKLSVVLKNSNSIALSYVPQINTWQNMKSVQLNLKDIKGL